MNRARLGDIVFCRIDPPNESSYWVVKEVSKVDINSRITHVCSPGFPDSQSKIDLFPECKIPPVENQGELWGQLARELQDENTGKIDEGFMEFLVKARYSR